MITLRSYPHGLPTEFTSITRIHGRRAGYPYTMISAFRNGTNMTVPMLYSVYESASEIREKIAVNVKPKADSFEIPL